MDPVATLSAERMQRYLATTRSALAKVRVVAPERSFAARAAASFMEMARAYFDDACHNHDAGEWVLAYAQVNYAHGWLDAGARLGLFDVGEDDQLFTLLD